MKILLLFGGQGVGEPNLYDLLLADKEGESFLSRASERLNINLVNEVSKITNPYYSQLLIGTYQLGVFFVLGELLKTYQIEMAGYSLGEVTAFLASIHANLETCVDVLKYRTELMTSLFEEGRESSYDLLSIRGRFELEAIDFLCFKHRCEIAIVNAKNHFIIGGKVSDLKNMLTHAREYKIDRFKFLSIDEPSHTSYYKTQSVKFADFLYRKVADSSLHYPMISPIKIRKIYDVHEEMILLGQELSSQLHWEKVCHLIPEYGYKLIVDLGPGSAMTSILKRSGARLHDQKIVTVANFKTLDGVRKHLSI